MRLFREVVLNFKRSGFMSFVSIGTIILAVTMLGGFILCKQWLTLRLTRCRTGLKRLFLLRTARQRRNKLLGDEITALSGVKRPDTYQRTTRIRILQRPGDAEDSFLF